ncbi:MAG TPA: threonine synthase [Candidatus Aminicenantes bacterium]|nr:threonine synthase [Candidatus Aminicenantes bacterium]
MRYVSTRGGAPAVSAAEAILRGIAPDGGLYVPETVPRVLADGAAAGRAGGAAADGAPGDAFRAASLEVLAPFLADIGGPALAEAVARAYNAGTFEHPEVVPLRRLDARRHVLELWHGPTAAFKDVALQIMPFLMAAAKSVRGDRSRTLILVATSGDTGKAALEGFRDRPGTAIVVFYPDGGVSEVQRLQMATTEGANTRVVAVRGNFDDCQTGVKALFDDAALRARLAASGTVLSSANSINWGRLAPQIAYYVRAYRALVGRGAVAPGGEIDLCVPTGNFGDILAGWYARAMGLPVRRLVCASNRNRVLTDFFRTGVYDLDREFHRTSSPSMDILISSNLERFLFHAAGGDAAAVRGWFGGLRRTGRFEVGQETRDAMAEVVVPGWADEPRVFETIREVFRETGYLVDTHTAVALAVCGDQMAAGGGLGPGGPPVVVVSTASPYKFPRDVLAAVAGERPADEFAAIERLRELSGVPVHRAVRGLRDKPERHARVADIAGMRDAVLEFGP